jgi:RimJ/RimL family protein N-acetyltransferase
MANASMDVKPVTLQLDGGVVRLEPLRLEHASDLLAAGVDDSVWTYLMERPRTLEDMRALIERALEAERSGREVPFAVVETSTGRAVGSTRYEDILRAHRSLEIGWTWYGVPWQRTACNTQCKYLLLRHAFEELKVMRVQLKTDRRNARSRAAIERLGARFEGILRHHMLVRGDVVRDSAYYGIIDTEWPEVKERLEAKLAQG